MPALGGDVAARSDDSSSCEIGTDRDSFAAECLPEVDLETGVDAAKKHLSESKAEVGCRICQLGLQSSDEQEEHGALISLGCSCKGDLASAHRKCAEIWFKIRGNMTCEICGAVAMNVTGGQAQQTTGTPAITRSERAISAGTQSFWHGRRVVNYMLVCMVFAFIVSWFFHFKVLR